MTKKTGRIQSHNFKQNDVRRGFKAEKDAEFRGKIQTGMIIDRLNKHVKGEITLTASQISAAKLLLNKCLPDLNRVEMTGPDGQSSPLGFVLIPQKAPAMSAENLKAPSITHQPIVDDAQGLMEIDAPNDPIDVAATMIESISTGIKKRSENEWEILDRLQEMEDQAKDAAD